MQLRPLLDILDHDLRSLHRVEIQLSTTLPRMARAAHCPKLRDIIEGHIDETERQKDRLDEILASSRPGARHPRGLPPQRRIPSEDHFRDLYLDNSDKSLLAALQRVERYEIGAYTATASLAALMGKDRIVGLLRDSLKEEQGADDKLEALARRSHRLEGASAAFC